MVDLSLIKKLREETGCGIADCNKALAACGDDLKDSIDWLRKKGLSSAAKKSTRITTEGLIAINNSGKCASIIELNSETDFVARNEKFQELALNIAEAGKQVKNNDNFVEEVKTYSNIAEEITNKIAIIGENLQLRRGKTISVDEKGVVISYLHNTIAPNLGKIGVLIALKSEASEDSLQELGKQIAMHIAASKPEFLNKESVPADRINREKNVLIEQAQSSGKPQNIIEKMIDGRIKKFYEEICLLDQFFVMDNEKRISDVLVSFEKENGKKVEIQEYCLYILGEGLDKKEENFAEEVASMQK